MKKTKIKLEDMDAGYVSTLIIKDTKHPRNPKDFIVRNKPLHAAGGG